MNAVAILHHFAKVRKAWQNRVTIAFLLSSVTSGLCTSPAGQQAANATAASKRPDSLKETTPVTAKDFFNTGTRRLQAGKLKEAEALLETALSKQVQGLQPGTLYNLGHIRYTQGIEELKR